MTRSRVEQVADAVLYEGYILYPYRPSSVKNRQRWTFGGVYPRAYSEAQTGSDLWEVQTECLIESGPDAALDIQVRFLHLLQRQAAELTPTLAARPETGLPAHRPTPLLRIGDRSYPTWQETIEREVRAEGLMVRALAEPKTIDFAFAAGQQVEWLSDAEGDFVGVLIRQHEALQGQIEVSSEQVEDRLFRVTVRVRNTTILDAAAPDREEALRHALISTHSILRVEGGHFVSLLEPPPAWQALASACRNMGTFPVLAGEEGSRDTMLSSPIILYDYPQVAPESPGDLFDAAEIDEILTLRILTLTEDEKQEMCAADERARLMLERTEALVGDDLLRLHGVMRNLRRRAGEQGNG